MCAAAVRFSAEILKNSGDRVDFFVCTCYHVYMKKFIYIVCAMLCAGMMGLLFACGTDGVRHEHTFETGWSRDDGYHWHKATCEHTDAVSEYAKHTVDNNGRCTVCGYYCAGDGDGAVITFDADGGLFSTGQTSVAVRADDSGRVRESALPLKSGYAFDGWYDGSERFDETATYTTEKTFTARYVSGDSDAVYSALFDERSLVSVKIDMSDSEWKKLSDDCDKYRKSPIYRYADSVILTIQSGGVKHEYYYDEVGVRLKGNTSRRKFYGDNGFYASVNFKLSFKQTFDDEDEYASDEIKTWDDKSARDARKDRRFATMEKIDVKWNSTADDTYVKELFALKLFRDNGIAAQNATLCTMSARNKDKEFLNMGIYKLYEPVDEAFLTRRFPDADDGDLYKCTWGSGVGSDFTSAVGTIGVEDELKNEFYTYDKKTNKKKDASGKRDFSSMIDFINGVNAPEDNFASLMDLDYFARFEAVNYLLGNPDCIRNNRNNFYMYFRPSDGKAIFIPYDYDRCLGIASWNPTGSACMYLKPYDNITAVNETQSNPVYKRLICKGAPSGEGSTLIKFKNALTALAADEMIGDAAFDAFKAGYKAKYAAIAQSAKLDNTMKFDSGGGNVSYSDYMRTKLKTTADNINDH